MSTYTNPTRPIIMLVNETTLTQWNIENNVQQQFTAETGKYYWYTIYFGAGSELNRTSPVYVGKTWCYKNEDGIPELKIDLTETVSAYTYSGYKSLQPKYNVDNQKWNIETVSEGGTLYPIDDLENGLWHRNGIGRNYAFVYFYNNPNNIHRPDRTIFRMDKEVTSSWNMNTEVLGMKDNYSVQDLLHDEYPFWTNHWPLVNTEEFSLSGMINIGPQNLPINGHIGMENNYINVNFASNGLFNTGGYLPFNVKLSDIISFDIDEPSSLATATLESYQITEEPENIFNTGGAEHYEPLYTYNGNEDETLNPNEVKITIGDTVVPLGIFDSCPAKYYLKWQTRSCAPACMGLNGRTTLRQRYEKLLMRDNTQRNLLKTVGTEYMWEISTGKIDKRTYMALQDIFTSPWIILYDVSLDRSFFVNIEANDFAVKENVFVDMQPYCLTMTLVETTTLKSIY